MKNTLLIASVAALALASCNMGRGVRGDGHLTSKTYTATGFRDIDAGAAMDIYLKQGPEHSVKIEAEGNILRLMEVRTEGDKLVIRFKDKVNINPTKDIKVYITAPDFHEIEGSGACSYYSQGRIKGNEIKLDLSGASNSDLDVEVNKLGVGASGASEIKVKGTAAYFSVDGSGSTVVHAFPLIAQHTKIELSGSGDAEVYAGESLEVDISGAGSVVYKGSPNSINKDISGAGSVSQAN